MNFKWIQIPKTCFLVVTLGKCRLMGKNGDVKSNPQHNSIESELHCIPTHTVRVLESLVS